MRLNTPLLPPTQGKILQTTISGFNRALAGVQVEEKNKLKNNNMKEKRKKRDNPEQFF